MIKDVMIRLDGTGADGPRLAAAQSLAETFHGQIIGLFLNTLPLPLAPDFEGGGTVQSAELYRLAKDVSALEQPFQSHITIPYMGQAPVARILLN